MRNPKSSRKTRNPALEAPRPLDVLCVRSRSKEIPCFEGVPSSNYLPGGLTRLSHALFYMDDGLAVTCGRTKLGLVLDSPRDLPLSICIVCNVQFILREGAG